jgi:catechol 1,2-dioxygenase
MKPLTSLSLSSRNSGRRDFLAWLAVAPALAGCTVASRDDSEPGPSGATPDPAAPDGEIGHEVDEGDVAMTEEAWTSCSTPTTRDAEGPYFEAGSPVRSLRIAALDEPGVRLIVEGRLVGPDCRALRGYGIDIWQADKLGNYYVGATSSFRLRGKVVSDAFGRYKFETVLPGRYGDSAGIRPAHLHAKILTPQGNSLLTTQLYFAGDPYLGQADYCTRSRYCNSADPKRALRMVDSTVSGTAGKRARFDAYLSRS